MLRKLFFLLLPLLLLLSRTSCRKNGTLSKSLNAYNEHNINQIPKENRIKRSLNSETENIFTPISSKLFDGELDEKEYKVNSDLEQPFWGMRGRRESSEELYDSQDYNFPSKNCKNCYKSLLTNSGDTKETLSPFWGNRGRRSSDEIEDNAIPDNPFWGNRGRRQEDEPFWGTRGRREQDVPFGGNRGRREEIKNGKFLNAMMVMKNHDDIGPFWGNRGRREAGTITASGALSDEVEPFWGNRGRRDTFEPFLGSRGRRKDHISSDINTQREQFSGNKQIPKTQLRDYTVERWRNVEDDMENSRERNGHGNIDPYYSNLEHETKILRLLTSIIGKKLRRKTNSMDTSNFGLHFKPSEPETILDDRMYAEQPRYILVERSSRSSAEDDPFIITRGKKFSSRFETLRGRRGALEELVKSVRNDPYYIARGKKFVEAIKIGNTTISKNDFDKVSELICSTIGLLTAIDRNNKEKRDINENDRDRRTILKKLAAQLQADPYFVSRGKKKNNTATDNGNLLELINQIAVKCD